MYTNADQLTTPKRNELTKLIHREKPLIIAINEVKPKNGSERKEQDYSFPNFQPFQTNMTNNTGRGIVILVHKSISSNTLQIRSHTSFEEACLLEIKLNNTDLLLFGCLYRSPTKTNESEENNIKMNHLINQLASNKKYTHICLVGDFNYKDIDWKKWSSPHPETSSEEKFLETLRDSFLYQHILEPTRRRGSDEPSLLDLVHTGEEEQISELSYTAPLGKSDHSVLLFNFNCYLDTKVPTSRFNYDKVDYKSIEWEITRGEWQEQFIQNAGFNSVEDNWNNLKEMLLGMRDKYVPKTKSSQWNSDGNFPISNELHQTIKEKDRLHRKWIKALNGENEDLERQRYVRVRNKVNRDIRQMKREHEGNICNESKENPKRFWQHIRSNLKTKSGIHPLLKSPTDKNSIKYEDADKAEILQDQFCSVFTREPDDDIPEFAPRTNKQIEIEITPAMVRKEIISLNVNKSIGPDEISPRLLRELVDHITVPLTIILNQSLAEGYLPDDWKMAIVSPIYKNKGAKNLAENYRPISLTSIICRVMETFLKQKIMNHLTQEKLLTSKQYGFVSKRSTITQLLHYLDKCTEEISIKKVVDVIYFDFAKAFDTVPHKRLLKKLQCYGVNGDILKWIEAFLTDRYQMVKVNEVLSTKRKVHSGVPQGSVLGPLLFVIYINDLPDVVRSLMYLFADDTKILSKIETKEDSKQLQTDIDALEKWSKDWLLKFHPDKCHVLTLGKFDHIPHAFPYCLGEEILDHVFSEKDLGITIDSELTFEEHIMNQVKKANSIVGLIKRSFEYLSPQLFKKLFTSFVRPHLEYGQVIWSPKLRKHANIIENIQRRATKIVPACRNLSYEARLEQIGIPTLEYRRKVCDMIEIFKHIHFHDNQTIPKRFIFRIRPTRRHDFELEQNFGNDGFRGVQTHFFYFRAIKEWNRLSPEVVNSKSVLAFRNNLNRLWKDKMYNLQL